MDKEIIQMVLQQIERVGAQQETILVKTTELAVEQKHLNKSVDEIRYDIGCIQQVQYEHSADIKEIKDALKDNQTFKDSMLEFGKAHPILAFAITLMVINIVLVSLGLPLVNISTILASFGGA